MSLSEMFKDDATKLLSLGRVISTVIVLQCLLISTWLAVTTRAMVDFPAGWAAAAVAFYGVNKVISSYVGGKKDEPV